MINTIKKIIVGSAVVILSLVFVGCVSEYETRPIVGDAVIVDFRYSSGSSSSNVTFDAVVVGFTEYGDEVTRRWRVTFPQVIHQFNIGDTVRMVDRTVLIVERGIGCVCDNWGVILDRSNRDD